LNVFLLRWSQFQVREVSKRVARKKRNLEEEHRRSPNGRRTAEDGKQHFGCHGLDEEQQS